jgi:hypothetical protein
MAAAFELTVNWTERSPPLQFIVYPAEASGAKKTNPSTNPSFDIQASCPSSVRAMEKVPGAND